MSETIRWWLILQVVGIAMLPLCLALFRRLPDCGYALSKPVGLILLGYVFWLLNSIHVLPNSGRGILGALVLLGIVSGWFFWRERDATLAWLRDHWQYILGVEALFLFVFAMAVYLRSLVGDISGTEQPMDLMFLNAATHADHFPRKTPGSPATTLPTTTSATSSSPSSAKWPASRPRSATTSASPWSPPWPSSAPPVSSTTSSPCASPRSIAAPRPPPQQRNAPNKPAHAASAPSRPANAAPSSSPTAPVQPAPAAAR